MDQQAIMDAIAELGQPTASMGILVAMAMRWPRLQRVAEENRAYAAALYALHLRDTRNQSAQVLSEREGDLSRTYANTQGSDPLSWSFWGRQLGDLIGLGHVPTIIVSQYQGDDCGCH